MHAFAGFCGASLALIRSITAPIRLVLGRIRQVKLISGDFLGLKKCVGIVHSRLMAPLRAFLP
tara:strand:- start:301 stop:489 length:189 start_codon:yes stop_codon:yes gene_type:complete